MVQYVEDLLQLIESLLQGHLQPACRVTNGQYFEQESVPHWQLRHTGQEGGLLTGLLQGINSATGACSNILHPAAGYVLAQGYNNLPCFTDGSTWCFAK